MARKFSPKVLTANELQSGEVVYWNHLQKWVQAFEDAQLFTEEHIAATALAKAESQSETIVGPYLADAASGPDGTPKPVHFREVFRKSGPSNYHHGKQAEV